MEQQITVAPNPKSVVFATYYQQAFVQPQHNQQVQQQQITGPIRNEAINLANKYHASKSCLDTKRNSINNVSTINTKARLTDKEEIKKSDYNIYDGLSTTREEAPNAKLYYTFMSTACLFFYLLTIVQVLG